MIRLYDYYCPKCGYEKEIVTRDDETFACPEDGTELKRLPPLFRVNTGPVPTGGYYDESLDTYITSNSHRKKVMEEQGVCERGATPKPNGQAWV